MKKIIKGSLVLIATGFCLNLHADNSIGLQYAKSVPKSQRKQMNQDISLIRSLIVEDADQSATRLFKTPVTGPHFEAWLAQRSRYVVPEDFKIDKNAEIIRVGYPFPNSVLPSIEQGSARPGGGGNVVTVMSNIGTAVYLAGKMQSTLLGVKIPGIGRVSATTPRIGVFQIGEGHFLPLLRRQGSSDSTGQANSLARLATFFHEARHSDGNAKSLGFVHGVCPAGHNYAGYNACDRAANGPYTIGAAFLKSVMNQNCGACSEAEKEALRITYMDSYSRVIGPVNPNPSIDDSLQATLRDTCALLIRLGTKTTELPSACSNLSAPTTGSNTTAQVEIWDDAPEYGPAQ